MRPAAKRAAFLFNHQFIQEYPMATTAAAVKEAPATKFAKDQLKAIIERIERLEEEKKTISDDPQMGMVCDHFTGSATAVLATQSFVMRTASLR